MSDAPTSEQLQRLRTDLLAAAERELRRRRRRLVAAAVVGVFVLGAGGAIAATQFDHIVSPADLAARATTVAEAYLDCSDPSGCVRKTTTHSQVDVSAADGFTFVLPSGYSYTIIPAAGVTGGPTHIPADAVKHGIGGIGPDGKFHRGTIHREGDAVVWPVTGEDGTKRVIRWWRSGRLTITDTTPGGKVTVTRPPAGSVLDLLPGQ
jgi:hypothetical protein